MIDRLARLLRQEPSEFRQALALGAILFAITSSYTLVKTARDSLYLAQLPAQTLPYVYLGVGIITLAFSQVYAWLTRRWAAWKSLAGLAGVAAVSLVVFASFFRLPMSWVPVTFYLWINVYGLLLVSQFWAFTNSISDPRLAKRILGIVGGGGILGGLAGGLIASGFGWAGLRVITIIGAALVALIMPLVLVSVRRGHAPAGEPEPGTLKKPTRPWSHAYVRWIALAALCSVVCTGLLDYQLKVEIQEHYPGRLALAAFSGRFYTALNLGALVLQLLFTRWALNRLGAAYSALILPGGLGIGAIATLVQPGLATVLGTRLWDQVVRLSLNKSAAELFYFPLEPALRRHTKAVVEAGLERLGDGIAGILLLAVIFTAGVTTWTIALMVAILVAIWLFAWWKVRLGYTRELGRNLQRMAVDLETATTPLRERGLLKEMVRLLRSPYERLVLNAIEMLEENAPRLLETRLPDLLAHPSARVRARALTRFAARPTEEAQAGVRTLLNDPDPQVRLEALRAHCALGEGSPTHALQEFLDAGEPELRTTALQCLVQYAPDRDLPEVRRRLENLMASEHPADRVRAAEALGYRPSPAPLSDLLTKLLGDPDLEVRRAALRSAGRVRHREHLPILIQSLADATTEKAAREGLTTWGERIVGTLGDHLIDPTVPLAVRRQIPRVLGDVPIADSVAALFRCRERNDVLLVYRILKAANHIRNADRSVPFPVTLVQEDLEHDVRSYLSAFVHRGLHSDRDGGVAEKFLCTVLDERRDQALNRIFRRLAPIYPPRQVYAAYRGLRSPDARLRGNALEYIENVLTPEHREVVMPLVDETLDSERQELMEQRYGLRFDGRHESLQALIEGNDPWLRTCALYVAGAHRDQGLREQVQRMREDEDPRVRETADWALAAMASG
jgi:AAA family ATP:ADP antiporter